MTTVTNPHFKKNAILVVATPSWLVKKVRLAFYRAFTSVTQGHAYYTLCRWCHAKLTDEFRPAKLSAKLGETPAK